MTSAIPSPPSGLDVPDVERRPELDFLLPAAAIALYLILILSFFRFPHCIDDAGIYFRYVDQWRTGHGFAYNAGAKPSYGASGVIYLFVLTAASYSGFGLQPLAMAIGVVSGCVCLALGYAIGLALFRSRLMAGGGAAMALLNPHFLIWSTGGLETNLQLALSLACVLAFVRRKPVVCGVLCALTILGKLDGAFVVLAIGLVALARDRRPPWPTILTAAIILLPSLVGLWLYFGSPVPISMLAKIQNAEGVSLSRFWLTQHVLQGSLGEICLAALPLILLRNPCADRMLTPLWFALYLAGYALFRTPEPYYWYGALPGFVFYMMAGQGMGLLLFRAGQARPARIPWLAALVLILFFLVREVRYIEASRRGHRNYITHVEQDRVDIGHWLAENMKDGEVAALSFGWPAYLCKHAVIDGTGLTDPRFAGKSIWEVLTPAEYPDYFVAHGVDRKPHVPPPRLARLYEPAAHFTRTPEATRFGPWTVYRKRTESQ